MNRLIVTDPLEADDLWMDLTNVIKILKECHIPQVSLFFGYSWGQSIYNAEWHDIPVFVDDIIDTVSQAEASGYGRMSKDNLYLNIPEHHVRLNYSYESDIQLSFMNPNTLVQSILDHWNEHKWLLVHQSKIRQKSIGSAYSGI